jgi:nitronate monooxygenase
VIRASYRNELLDLLGIQLPIIQAPMAGVSTPEMAAAVMDAGGLGSIGAGATDAAAARAMIRAVRERSRGSLNVNVFCHQPATPDAAVEAAWIERLRPEFERFGAQPPRRLTAIYQSFLEDEQMLEVLLEEKPAVVSFHFGVPPRETLECLRGAGIVLLGCATTLKDALLLQEAGIHAVIAQGYEAGGHRGLFEANGQDDRMGTLALTRLLATRLTVPVIAAGAIMDGNGIRAALTLGASAAQLGTAFIACLESQADAGYRAALRSNAAYHTMMTRAISGRPARALSNRFTQLGSSVAADEIPCYPIAYDAAKALHAAAKASGEHGYGAQWAGQGAPMIREAGAADVVNALASELFA